MSHKTHIELLTTLHAMNRERGLLFRLVVAFRLCEHPQLAILAITVVAVGHAGPGARTCGGTLRREGACTPRAGSCESRDRRSVLWLTFYHHVHWYDRE